MRVIVTIREASPLLNPSSDRGHPLISLHKLARKRSRYRAEQSSQETHTVSFQIDLDRFGQTLVREAPDAIIYADAEGFIRFWNRGAERIFGFGEAEVMGKSLDIVIPENLRKRHWDGYTETMRSGETRFGAGDILAVPALRNDGTRVSIEFTIVPFRDVSGRMVGIAAILRDVTKRFEEMKALRQQLAERRVTGGSNQNE
jgi:PAS domain S-box-containing protein